MTDTDASSPASVELRVYRPGIAWCRTITRWCVVRAFEAVGCPDCLAGKPELQATFVVNISGAVGLERLAKVPNRAAKYLGDLRDRLYREACGPEYCRLTDEYDHALDESLKAYDRTYYEQHADDMLGLETDSEKARFYKALIDEVEELDRKADALKQKAALLRTKEITGKVEATLAEASRAFWREDPSLELRNDFFAEIAADHPYYPESRMMRIDDDWWVRFKNRLQAELKRRNPVEWFLLDDLPCLREEAKVSGEKLATLVENWRAERAPRMGLPASIANYCMIEERGRKKAFEVDGWFKAHPNNISPPRSASDALERHLAERDTVPYTGYSLRPNLHPEGWRPTSRSSQSRRNA